MTRKTVKLEISINRKWFKFIGSELAIGHHWFKSNKILIEDIEEIMKYNTKCKQVHDMYKVYKEDYLEVVEYSI